MVYYGVPTSVLTLTTEENGLHNLLSLNGLLPRNLGLGYRKLVWRQQGECSISISHTLRESGPRRGPEEMGDGDEGLVEGREREKRVVERLEREPELLLKAQYLCTAYQNNTVWTPTVCHHRATPQGISELEVTLTSSQGALMSLSAKTLRTWQWECPEAQCQGRRRPGAAWRAESETENPRNSPTAAVSSNRKGVYILNELFHVYLKHFSLRERVKYLHIIHLLGIDVSPEEVPALAGTYPGCPNYL